MKPIVPVIHSEHSVGYLRQLSLCDAKGFREGFHSLLRGNYEVQSKTILQTEINGKIFIALNEIYLNCEPHLGKFLVNIYNTNQKNWIKLCDTMAGLEENIVELSEFDPF